jgi:hypothetical protein
MISELDKLIKDATELTLEIGRDQRIDRPVWVVLFLLSAVMVLAREIKNAKS